MVQPRGYTKYIVCLKWITAKTACHSIMQDYLGVSMSQHGILNLHSWFLFKIEIHKIANILNMNKCIKYVLITNKYNRMKSMPY